MANKRIDKVLNHLAPAPKVSPITTHCLDTSRGHPAQDMTIFLEKLDTSNNQFSEMGRGKTDADGRIKNLLPSDHRLQAGVYRMTFLTADYYKALNTKCFYPLAQVTFEIEADKVHQHYHIPLLLNPYGFSTYRGS
eukprot:TRINITY_DN13142_c0_g2_i3.p1 TRINITY_DN13142_c0_g2~~TRINITY_DN13142_c0_g2_i3.p1  ORF type:complete len:155 (-),score=45.70 TRINITY_DN13142_c0_g2_i3:39-446(-)